MESSKDTDHSIRAKMAALGSESNLHGIGRIVSERPILLRILWLLAFLGAVGFGIFQVSKIFGSFMQYPIKTNIQIKFNPLQFPAVTICNMNIIKKSESKSLDSKKLQDILQGSYNLTDYYSGTTDFFYSSTSPYTTLASTTTSGGSTTPSGSGTSTPSAITTASSAYPSTTSSGLFDFLTTSWYDPWYDSWASWSSGTGDFYGDSDYVSTPPTVSKDQIVYFSFVDEYQKLDRVNRSKAGHQIENMLIDCSFAGASCDGPAKTIVTYDYGNCYTLQSPRYTSASSGPLGGMTLTINLENHESFEEMTEGYGLRLVLHEVGSFPLPLEKGITVSGGYETSLALKLTRVKRLGKPYGDCQDPTEYFNKYFVRYTTQGCIQTCWENLALSSCACIAGYVQTELQYFTSSPNLDDLFININDTASLNETLTETNTTTGTCFSKTQKECYERVRALFLLRTSDYCHCPPPCYEDVYSVSFSGSLWPHSKKVEELKNKSCSTYNDTSVACGLDSLSASDLSSNFLKVRIYFEELNYEEITEEPLYDVNQIIADVGGSLGLCFGFSLLCVCEALEAMVEVLLVMKRKMSRKTKVEEKSPQ